MGEEPHFEGGPYEWWVDGGKKLIEPGRLVGVVRAVNLNPDNTLYSLHHSYNGDGKISIVLILIISIVMNVHCFSAF